MRAVLPDSDPVVAVMVVVSRPIALARPPLAMVATEWSDDDHVTLALRSAVEPSL